MKKILYIDKFFSDDLYDQFSSLSLSCEYSHTNPAKRSFASKNISELNSTLYDTFIKYVKDNLNIELLNCKLNFYKRKNTVFNPHVDGFPLQILIYLQGEKNNLENGTFFNKNNSDEIAIQVSNIPNSAIIFDGKFFHGSIQAKYLPEDIGWRYSLNCFVKSYK
jgi:hypothetical protein